VTAFLINVAVVGTVAFCAWRGYKNGLIRGVFGVVSLIVSLMVANIAAQAYSNEAKGMLMPFVSGILDTTISEMADEGIEYQPLAHDHGIDDADFGTAYTALRRIGFPEAASVRIAEQALETDEEDEDVFFSDRVAERLSTSLAYVAVFGIAFLLVAIVFAVAGNLIGLVFSLPGLKLIDIIAGSLLGVVKGIILIYTVAVIFRYYGVLILPILERTTVLNTIVNNNPIANMLGV